MIEIIYKGFRIEKFNNMYSMIGFDEEFSTLIDAMKAIDVKWEEIVCEKYVDLTKEPL